VQRLQVGDPPPQVHDLLLGQGTDPVAGVGLPSARCSSDCTSARVNPRSWALAVLILIFGPISGAHFNPIVILVDWRLHRHSHTVLAVPEVAAYLIAQTIGAIGGAMPANLMFSRAPVTFSPTHRSTANLWLGEVVATAGLVLLIFALMRTGRPCSTPDGHRHRRHRRGRPRSRRHPYPCQEPWMSEPSGSAPADQINPLAIEAMNELGIDITDQNPKSLPPQDSQASTMVITMGCGDVCLYYLGPTPRRLGHPRPRRPRHRTCHPRRHRPQ